jgi:hypothetical protein
MPRKEGLLLVDGVKNKAYPFDHGAVNYTLDV